MMTQTDLLKSNIRSGRRFFRPLRSALSLLEVVLALAILGISTAMLAQAIQIASTSGLYARQYTQAQLVAESKMSEVIAGLVPIGSASTWTPVMMPFSDTTWNFMVVQNIAEMQGMMSIQVIVTNDPMGATTQPVTYSLTRWIIDPNLGLDVPPEETTEATGATPGAAAASAGSAPAAGGI